MPGASYPFDDYTDEEYRDDLEAILEYDNHKLAQVHDNIL